MEGAHILVFYFVIRVFNLVWKHWLGPTSLYIHFLLYYISSLNKQTQYCIYSVPKVSVHNFCVWFVVTSRVYWFLGAKLTSHDDGFLHIYTVQQTSRHLRKISIKANVIWQTGRGMIALSNHIKVFKMCWKGKVMWPREVALNQTQK